MISFIDLKKESQEISEEIRAAFRCVQERGWYVLGDELLAFEKDYAQYTGTQFCIGVNSGSDALVLALKAIGISPGDEVILPSHTFVATADAVVRNGAIPVFADIDPETYCIDPNAVASMVTPRTKAIIPVHLYGHPADMDPLIKIADEHNIHLIEDACQAHGSEYRSRKAGSMGIIGCFSFYPGKNLGAYGDAGCIVTSDKKIDEKIRMERNYGQKTKYQHTCIGMNSRMDEIQAAVLRVKLKYLDRWNEKRRRFASLYDDLLAGCSVIRPIEREYARHVYHLYVIRSKKRDILNSYLKKKGIETGIHYPIPVHQQKAYRGRGYYKDLKVTESVSGEVLSLPLHPWMDDEEVRYIAQMIKKCL
ncbi:MAG: DegT/DnrJ/EryC1/StrS family aminotransferase [Methanoregulaceae archaeon]|nr:DegT/DnrJ/EryC1/StrS family aminotransferase [Methanoregulaceae archaeon]